MSLFGSIFGGGEKSDQNPRVQWIDLTSVEQFREAIDKSFEEPVLIFKHSTRCSVSRMALRQFESNYKSASAKAYFLDLLQFRSVSQAIESELNVVHQSPQILVLKNGKCIFTQSHGEIDADDVQRSIEVAFA